MLSQNPEDWRITLPSIYEYTISLPKHHVHLFHVVQMLSSIQNESSFKELITDNFLFKLYHACVEYFQVNHKKPVLPCLDDLENTLIELMGIYIPNGGRICAQISIDNIKQHLECIDKRMEQALENGDIDNYASIAENIKAMANLLLRYYEYLYALMELEKKFGSAYTKTDYIAAISTFLTSTELDLEDAVHLYHQCVYSRIFLGHQAKLEQLFTSVFDALMTKENINHLFDLTYHPPCRLSTIQTILIFKQATTSTSKHGYFNQLGLFIKYANHLLLNKAQNPYYLNLFIHNMSSTSAFGPESPILVSLKKIRLTMDILQSLCECAQFKPIMAGYIYKPFYALKEINERIRAHVPLLTQCVKKLNFLENIKLFYLYPSDDLLKAIHKQQFRLIEMDISQLDVDAFVAVQYFMKHSHKLDKQQAMLNMFEYAHEALCAIHVNLNALRHLAQSCLPYRCPMFLGIQNILFGAKLLDTLFEIKQQMPEAFQESIGEIQTALEQKNISMMERLHKAKNICEDLVKRQEPTTSGYHVLQQILKGVEHLEAYNMSMQSQRRILCKKDMLNLEQIMKAIYPTQNGSQLSS
jgi:hypothetical protein